MKQFFFGTKIRIGLTTVGLLLLLYALAGFIAVPWLARPKIVEAVAELTGRETRLDVLKLNPFTLSGSLGAFEITDNDGERLLSFDQAHGNMQALPFLFGNEIHLKELDLTKPFFRFQIDQSGSINIADIINNITELGAEDNELKTEPKADSKAFRVDLLKVSDGAISVTDLSRSSHFSSIIEPINFDITGFHTSGESDAPYSFSASSESGESLSWSGFVALEPLRSKGSFEVEGFSMPKYEPFYDIVLQTDIVGGKIGVQGSYEYSSGNEGVIQLQDASISFEDVEVVKGSDQSPVLSLTKGSISGVNFDLLDKQLEVLSIDFNDGVLHAQRLADGQIDLITLIDNSALPSASEESQTIELDEPESPPINYHIQGLNLNNFSIEVIDYAAPTTASFALDNTTLGAKNIRSELGEKLEINLSSHVRSGGTLSAKGSAGIQPLGGSLDIEIAKLGLEPANPYISDFADIQLASGNISISGHADIDLSGDNPTGTFAGDLKLEELEVIGGELGQDLAQLTQLEFADVQADLNPLSLNISRIKLVDPRANILINEDGSINLKKALRMETTEVADAETIDEDQAEEEDVDKPSGMVLPFPIAIGSVTLENVGAILTDRSISPPVNLGLETLSGTISGLSSEELARADLDLNGKLTGGTQIAVTGKINPLIEDRYSDVEMTFKNFNLTAVSPYAGKYAGYALQKGKLSFDLKYKVSQSELSGENVMVIDQLTLGDKVESEDALKLPIPLAVSLMKDRNGVINIDIPVSGNLNDPTFSFGRVISQAILNVLTKLITSPFSILGGLIPGGKDVDLSLVTFTPGQFEFDEDTQKKLSLLADALKERPNLTLEISGGAGGIAEINNLRSQLLEENLKTLRWRELKDAGNDSITVGEVVLTSGDRNRLVQTSFNLMFPEEAVEPSADPAAPDESTTIENEVGRDDSIPPPTTTPEEEAETGGIAGFFKKIFGGPNKEESETIEPVVKADNEPTSSEPIVQNEATADAVPSLTVAQMESRLLENLEISDDDLHSLADKRSEVVRAYLQSTGEIAPERLFIIEPEDPATVAADSGEPLVVFNLE